MDNFFGTIYSWFRSFYGDYLNLYLWGYDPATQNFSNPNINNHVGLATLAISLIVVLVFYYVINHPKFNKWWSWLITLIINSLLNFGVAFGVVFSKYTNGNIPANLMYDIDANGNILAEFITKLDCIGFGVANLFTSALFFFVLSFILKWWSSNAKHAPFI